MHINHPFKVQIDKYQASTIQKQLICYFAYYTNQTLFARKWHKKTNDAQRSPDESVRKPARFYHDVSIQLVIHRQPVQRLLSAKTP